jgi:hypothetical protein
MSPPQICPPPPDCPLYAQRLGYEVDEPLRRAILTARPMRPDLAALVRAEALRTSKARPALPAPSEPVVLPILKQKGVTHG